MITIDPNDLTAYLHALDEADRRAVSWHPVDCCLDGDPAVIAKLESMTRDDVVLAYALAIKIAAIEQRVSSLLSAGYPTAGGLHIALDDASRSDMGSMATTALAAASGAVPWPDSYAQGWITSENVRIAMPQPSDGLALAALVGDYYAAIRQRGRTLKDLVAVAASQSDLDAIDVDSGWPN